MTSLARKLVAYREYHHDPRNVVTHAVGIPMIVLAITTLLARPVFEIGGMALTPAIIVAALAAAWYVQLDVRMGLVMTALLALFVVAGGMLGTLPTPIWLGAGIALFVTGWIFQLVGHKFEGRKPAFVDDLRSLLVGPLFVVVEGLFALGLLKGLRREMG